MNDTPDGIGTSERAVNMPKTAGIEISSAGPIANDAIALIRSTEEIDVIILTVFTILNFKNYYY